MNSQEETELVARLEAAEAKLAGVRQALEIRACDPNSVESALDCAYGDVDHYAPTVAGCPSCSFVGVAPHRLKETRPEDAGADPAPKTAENIAAQATTPRRATLTLHVSVDL